MSWFKNLFSKKEENKNNLVKIEDKYESTDPWVDVVRVTMQDKNDPSTGYFELDWNSAFVMQLSEAGYSGRTEDEIVEQWFNDLCRGIVADTLPE